MIYIYVNQFTRNMLKLRIKIAFAQVFFSFYFRFFFSLFLFIFRYFQIFRFELSFHRILYIVMFLLFLSIPLFLHAKNDEKKMIVIIFWSTDFILLIHFHKYPGRYFFLSLIAYRMTNRGAYFKFATSCGIFYLHDKKIGLGPECNFLPFSLRDCFLYIKWKYL